MKEVAERLIFPLDFQEIDEALSWIERLRDYVGVFKIGLELFVKYGPPAIERAKKAGARKIFLDLKFHDIPNTVQGAIRSAESLGVDFVTVHILSGRSALERAVRSSGGGMKILGVTILTSLDKADLLELGFNGELLTETEELVHRLTLIAQSTGCDGVVVSAKEVRRVKSSFPHLITVVPGIRLEEGPRDDQLRTSTPYEAILNGADYLVIGRPIRDAEEPEKICLEIHSAIERALAERHDLQGNS